MKMNLTDCINGFLQVALIGFFPLYMGLLHLYEILKEDGCLNRCSGESEADATAAAATSGNATGFARVGQDESDAVFENSNPILYSADTSEHSGLQLTKSDQSDLENGHSGEQPTDLKMEDGEMEEVTIILSGNSEDTRAANNDSEEKKDEEEGEEEESNALADCVKTHCQYWMHPFILEVSKTLNLCILSALLTQVVQTMIELKRFDPVAIVLPFQPNLFLPQILRLTLYLGHSVRVSLQQRQHRYALHSKDDFLIIT